MESPSPLKPSEEIIPINISNVLINTMLGPVMRENVHYYNIIVKNCPPYVLNPDKPDNYIRTEPIERIRDFKGINWPDHPKNIHGDYTGAIIVLESKDDKILLVRNGILWGLPKGVRNFTRFNQLKNECNEHYSKHGQVPTFQEAEFTEIESSIDNICRETYEETGITLDPNKLITVDDTCAYTKYYYKLDFDSSDYIDILNKHGTDHENDELLWVTKQELTSMVMRHRTFRQVKVFNHVTFSFLGGNYIP